MMVLTGSLFNIQGPPENLDKQGIANLLKLKLDVGLPWVFSQLPMSENSRERGLYITSWRLSQPSQPQCGVSDMPYPDVENHYKGRFRYRDYFAFFKGPFSDACDSRAGDKEAHEAGIVLLLLLKLQAGVVSDKEATVYSFCYF
jgi:hypothetical protein